MKRLCWVLSSILLLCGFVGGQTTLPGGTRLRVQMQTPVDTRTSHVGDVLEALVVEPLQNGHSILVPVGARLTGRVAAVSTQSKAHQTHALIQLSFDELILLDGQHLKIQAQLQSLGLNEQVDSDGIATIHPLSHDFALKTGRKLWLRINASPPMETNAAVALSNPVTPVRDSSSVSQGRDNSKASARLGDLLITLNEMEDPAGRPRYTTESDRREVVITGTVKNVGKNPVCALIQANLETSFKLAEPVTITFAGQDGGLIRELLPAEQFDAEFTSSVKNGTDPLKLKLSQSEPEQGCGDNSHHIFWTDVGIPLAGLPRLTESSPPHSDGSDKPGEALKVTAGVSPPRLIRHVEPEFSKEARKGRHEGKVVVRVTVGTDGRIHDPHVVKSLGWGLDEKAIEAVSQWVFDPAVKDGRKVAVYVDIEVNFRLGAEPRF